ncbi:hypothetical protein [Flavivirga rizhaonensis]|uniref:Fibronectin type-III domain-containing protein n=1 Tax=Flavivirga rizhaonensis TaxID=2559571 RepID=A0A4S1DXS1_9FLAO|nr:hypothetical protein [Flavivirga rizhaonensis]TGV02967.1 hypothetical protein EM932_08235 [Flavivirga rizhaonensis]
MKNVIYLIIIGILTYSCSGGGDDSDTQAENKAPTKVSTLTYPTNNLLCITNVLDFQWEAASDPDGDPVSYVLEISQDNGFTAIDESFTVSNTNKTVTLDKGIAYYWRVKATDSKNLSSDYSSVYQFYTEGEGSLNHLPFAPELLSPELNTTISSGTVNLNWKANDVDDDSLTYDVFFGTENPPVNKEGDNQGENNLTVNINASTDYYWKVIVKDSNGGQTIGQVWSFSTQ